jgi:hypothetical protein
MASNIFSRLAQLLNRVVDIVSQGNLERVRIIREFNLVFKEAYLGGDIERHCTVTTSPGNPEFKHELSTFYLRSGFKITIENDNNLAHVALLYRTKTTDPFFVLGLIPDTQGDPCPVNFPHNVNHAPV